jgi:hypothetical protein
MARHRDSGNGLLILGSAGLGAALMYFCDPQGGRRRRALLRDQWEHTARKLKEGQRVIARDATNRAHGLITEASRRVKRAGLHADDVVLIERVRAALGRQVSHPHAIEVQSSGGIVRLGGAILAHEVDNLIGCVKSVRGVKGVENQLSVCDDAGNLPALQGGVPREGHRPEFLQSNWSPTARALAGGFGAFLALFGLMRGGLGGLALGALGGGLIARAATNRDVRSLAAEPLLPRAAARAVRRDAAPRHDARPEAARSRRAGRIDGGSGNVSDGEVAGSWKLEGRS